MNNLPIRYALNLTFYEMAAVNIAIADRLKNFEEKVLDPALIMGREFYEEEIGHMKAALEQSKKMKAA